MQVRGWALDIHHTTSMREHMHHTMYICVAYCCRCLCKPIKAVCCESLCIMTPAVLQGVQDRLVHLRAADGRRQARRGCCDCLWCPASVGRS